MADWLEHVTIATPRNGTTTHTVTPSSGTVAAGALFTPTAGRLLVCIVGASVTSTTPVGWTLPTGGNAVNNTELDVWWRTAAGSDSLTTTHNSSNYPAVFDFYEFGSGSTFVKSVTGSSVANGGTGPNLTGLTGTNWTAGAACWGVQGTGTWSVAWATGTEVVDTAVAGSSSPIDGYVYGLTATDSDAGTSRSYAATETGPVFSTAAERLVFAVKAVGGAAASVPPMLIMPTWRP